MARGEGQEYIIHLDPIDAALLGTLKDRFGVSEEQVLQQLVRQVLDEVIDSACDAAFEEAPCSKKAN